MSIAVIGAGASGMAAALMAARHGADVTLYERNTITGRKLLVTGSGRCNISNRAASADKYTCASTTWLASMLQAFGVDDLLTLLHEIGIPLYSTHDGWYYPLSNSAQTVADTFSSALTLAGVKVITETHISGIRHQSDGFSVYGSQAEHKIRKSFAQVIICSGGMAYPSLGSTGDLFPVLEKLGHRVVPLRPALAPVLADVRSFHSLQGVRLDAGTKLLMNNETIAASRGNLIFTQWGINGPAVMDISHHIPVESRNMELSLNLLAYYQSDYDGLLERKRRSDMPLRVLLGAFFVPKVTQYLMKSCHLAPDTVMSHLERRQLLTLTDRLQNLRLTVKGVRGFEYCQLSAGGVPVNEVDAPTLESRFVEGLYLAGETLDVVGPCGGYNLQFAFSSGALAGMAAAAKDR